MSRVVFWIQKRVIRKKFEYFFIGSEHPYVARQDSKQKGPAEDRDARHTYAFKANSAKIDWPCYNYA